MPINLTEQIAPKNIKMNFGAIKNIKFSFGGYYKILARWLRGGTPYNSEGILDENKLIKVVLSNSLPGFIEKNELEEMWKKRL